ncbi:hypothetical protein MCOLE_v1c03570 [Mesoplasma coleopterae]|uniref:Uncharacterized protein n=1 Tax=Mesoplasma coleopterae TaxID=324078 RepID=A0A2K8P281_9MOLU|nr:hypothetical protein MCOLE_v1c03570 [Mesoplasma coleopterae]
MKEFCIKYKFEWYKFQLPIISLLLIFIFQMINLEKIYWYIPFILVLCISLFLYFPTIIRLKKFELKKNDFKAWIISFFIIDLICWFFLLAQIIGFWSGLDTLGFSFAITIIISINSFIYYQVNKLNKRKNF